MSGEKKNTSKILVGIIIVLVAVIAALVVYMITGNKNDNSQNKEKISSDTDVEAVEDTEETEKNNSSDSSEQEKAVDETDSNEADNRDCYVTVSNSNSWEANGGYAGQFDAKIINESSSEISNWSIEIQVPDGATVESSWNGNFELKDNVLTITPVDYNNKVSASGQVADIGFIMDVKTQADLQTVTNNVKLYVNGTLYVSDSQNDTTESGNPSEEENDNSTESKSDENENNSDIASELGSPFDNHGKLSVSGTDLVDKSGNKYQLKGVSTHGIAWFPDYVNKDAFQTFRDDWGANLIRLAMYTDDYNGYCSGGDQTYLKNLVDTGVNAATELGMYVIVDWHILNDSNPQTHKEDAKVFFDEMSKKYAGYDNVLYEICNEPNGGTSWADIKSYAEEIIPIIRANAPDAIIIVGTPTWSQDVDIASQDPITGYNNIMYTVHFYAATHTDSIRSKVETAISNGLPIFISEFSICDASGNGAIDYNQAEQWFDLVEKYNLSYAGWNVSNKDETSSLIKSSCTKISGWTDDDLSETGIWLKSQIKGIN